MSSDESNFRHLSFTCLSYPFTRVCVFVAETGEQDMHQLCDVLSYVPVKVSLHQYPWLWTPGGRHRQRVPPAALARGWVWNMLGPFGNSLNAQLGKSNVATTALALHESESWCQPFPQVKGARQECKCISGEIRAVICISSRRLRRMGVLRWFLFPF